MKNFLKSSKKLYYRNKLQINENKIKITRKIIKEIIGKSKVFHENFPKDLRTNNFFQNKQIFRQRSLKSSY